MSQRNWVENASKDWKVLPLKYTCDILNGYAFDSNSYVERGIPVIRIGDISKSINWESVKRVPQDHLNRLLRFKIKKGDILIALTGATIGKSCIFQEDTIALLNQRVAAIRTAEFSQGFLAYIIQSKVFIESISYLCDGGAQENIGKDDIGKIYCTIPPIHQQKSIAHFLDRKTATIDTLIAKKQRLIQLLEEKRTALINQAVTKGLNPNAPMKDSGIPWIGEIPEHWEVKRLKFIAEVRSGVAKGRDLKDKNVVELPYLRVANVQDGYLDLSDISTISIEIHEERRYLLHRGDILMNEGGDDDKLGRGAVWDAQIERCIHQNHVFAVRPFRGVNSFWINLATQASYLKHFFLVRSKKTTNLASISSSNLKESPILFPPLQEQEEILTKVQEKLERLQNIYKTLVFQIEKLQEYRRSLITAAVTGKLDIQEVDHAC